MQQDLSYFVILCVQKHKSKAKYFWEERTALELIPAAIEQADSVAQDKRKHIKTNMRIKGVKIKVMCSRYRPVVAQRVGRSIHLLFHDRGTRRGWLVSSTPRPHFTPGKEPVPILQEAGWAPGPVWTGGNSRPHWDSIPDRPDRSQPLYRLNYPAQG